MSSDKSNTNNEDRRRQSSAHPESSELPSSYTSTSLSQTTETPKCPFCLKLIRAEFVVCPHCGKTIAEKCPGCGRTVENTWIKCPQCKSDLPIDRMKEIQADIEEVLLERRKTKNKQTENTTRKASSAILIAGIIIVLLTLIALPFISSQAEDIRNNPGHYKVSYDKTTGRIYSPDEQAGQTYFFCTAGPLIIGIMLVIVGVAIKTKDNW